MIKGFIFDLDGVIVDTAPLHFNAWEQLASQININLDPKLETSLRGISRMDSLDLILNHAHLNNTYSQNEKEHLASIKNNIYKESLSTLTPEDILPGVLSFLKQAKKCNIFCAIASASLNAPLIIERLKLEDYFSVIVDPKKLKYGKPNPEIFLKAAELLNLTTKEVIGFEDAPSGIKALNAANIYSIGITDDPNTLSDAKKIITSFEELSIEDLLNIE